MSHQLPNEDAVLSAVRQFLKAGAASRNSEESMTLLISETSRLGLSNLDAWERVLRAEIANAQRLPSGPWKFLRKPASFASWLDLCSGDGFKRERILRSLTGTAPNSFFFSLAVRRLNDWVPQVRAAARERLPGIAERSDPEIVVDVLWNTLPTWTSWGRLEEPNRQVLTDLICLKPVSLSLRSRLMRATAGPAASILAQAGRTHVMDKWLGELARDAVQPSLRAKAYRTLLEGRITWVSGRRWSWTDIKWCKGRFEPVLEQRVVQEEGPFLEMLKAALGDRSPLVRRIAADQLMLRRESVGADLANLAKALAADSSPYIAERGRFVLNRIAGVGHESHEQ